MSLPDIATSLRLETGALQVHFEPDGAVLEMMTASYDAATSAMDISVLGPSAPDRVAAIRQTMASSLHRGRGAASAAG